MLGITMMQYSDANLPTKTRINLSVSEPLLREARALGVNLSRAAESGIAKAMAEHYEGNDRRKK